MIDEININKTLLDGVYFDNVDGVDGTIWPIGTPAKPVNNLADAKLILAARGLSKLYLVGSNATVGGYELRFNTDTNIEIVGNSLYNIIKEDGITVYISSDLIGSIIGSNGAGSINIYGDCNSQGYIGNYEAGSINIYGDCNCQDDIGNYEAGSFYVLKNCFAAKNIFNDATPGPSGTFSIAGNCFVVSSIDNTDGDASGSGQFEVFGNLVLEGDINNTGVLFWIHGDCTLGVGTLTNAALATVTIDGTFKCYGVIANLGTLTYRGLLVSTDGSPYSQPNDLNEHDAIVIAADNQLIDIEMDMTLLAQANTVREYSDSIQVSAKVFPTDFDAGTNMVILSFIQKGVEYKVTMQSSIAEGAAKNIPYRVMTRSLN